MKHDPADVEAILAVFSDAGQLKTQRRAGWIRAGIVYPESVADHSYRLAVMAMLIGPRLGLDVAAMVRLCLIHDLAEAQVGDLTPSDRVTPAEKRYLEATTLGHLFAALPEGPVLYDVWCDYDSGATPEARIVRQLDKLELATQALEYELRYDLDLTEFWLSARAKLTEPLLIQLYDRLWQQRPSRD